QPEAPELAPAEERAAEVASSVGLEHVDEGGQRSHVAELEPGDPERDPGQPAQSRLAAVRADPLLDADERREEPGQPLHLPDAVELAHAVSLPRHARPKRALPAHGGRARGAAARARRLAVRAEVGRIPRRPRERRRRARAVEPERPAAPSLLPRAARA